MVSGYCKPDIRAKMGTFAVSACRFNGLPVQAIARMREKLGFCKNKSFVLIYLMVVI